MSALIWFFPCMNHYMLVNNTIFYKKILTMTSLIWFLPSMSPHMSCKVNYFKKVINHNGCIGMDSLLNESLYAAQVHFYLQRLSLLQFNF